MELHPLIKLQWVFKKELKAIEIFEKPEATLIGDYNRKP